MKRRATYTVEVPIRFTYSADSDLDREQLLISAEKELEQRLINGYFDVLDKKLQVVDKVTHFTREEIREQKKMWDEILNTMHNPEPKPVNVFVKIFKGGKS